MADGAAGDVSDEQQRSMHDANPWVVLSILLTATFVELVDVSIVNVAIPSIQRDLHATKAEIQLVLAGYQLAFACVLITAARLGDIYGRKRLFLVGMVSFTIASAVSGAAPNAGILVLARLFQGAASGLMFPQVLSVLQVVFRPSERGRALGLHGAVLGLATILGPVLGGALLSWNVAGLEWRSIFYVNVPIGIQEALLYEIGVFVLAALAVLALPAVRPADLDEGATAG